MTSRHRYSTAAVAPDERLAYWNNVAVGVFGPVEIDAEGEPFHGEITRVVAGRCEITSVRSTGSVVRDGPKADLDGAFFRLMVIHSGQCRMLHAGRESRMEAGDVVVLDLSKTGEIAFDEPMQALVVELPADRFARRTLDLERVAGQPISGKSGPAAVLSDFLRSSWDHLAESERDDWPMSASEVLWDLCELACRQAGPGKSRTSIRHRHLQQARAVIDSRLLDPDLQPSDVAEALGLSARYLQLLFSEMKTTPSRFILARRLEHAAERLRREGKAANVTEVALDAGFNDLSHFSRVFRRRFGMPPRTYRASFGEAPEVIL
jgi:AraC-like DNA-binding protein